ncbi:MAG: hypothetical protein KIG14_01365 [Candidatus Sacchiramonaceae bacterium]|nr:hypothetical protein [Candidatus Saccharimonadaceae bacterium]
MNIYFSGIGGVGIGPLAELAASAGHKVFGSDSAKSLTTDRLESQDFDIKIGEQNGDFLQQIHQDQTVDWFVYTAALPADHPELVMARELNLKTSKRDELLNHLIEEKNLKLIAVSGTHGKTSTTGMLIWVFKQLGIPASWSIGTTLNFGEAGFFDPRSEYFIYEADEFDRNFLHFSPFVSLITSIDYDHTDIYKTPEEYLEAFIEFAAQSEFTMSWKDQNGEIFKDIKNRVLLTETDPEITLPGEHSKRNATLVAETLDYIESFNPGKFGEDLHEKAISAINSFPGIDRRFERISDNIYSDYGHHPVEIKATLQMAREVAESNGLSGVALVYQPHQNVRQVEVQDEYTDDIFKNAGKIIWLPTYLSRENPDLEILSPEFLARKIENEKIKFSDLNKDLSAEITKLKGEDYLVLAMSAGTLDGWVRDNFAR